MSLVLSSVSLMLSHIFMSDDLLFPLTQVFPLRLIDPNKAMFICACLLS